MNAQQLPEDINDCLFPFLSESDNDDDKGTDGNDDVNGTDIGHDGDNGKDDDNDVHLICKCLPKVNYV